MPIWMSEDEAGFILSCLRVTRECLVDADCYPSEEYRKERLAQFDSAIVTMDLIHEEAKLAAMRAQGRA